MEGEIMDVPQFFLQCHGAFHSRVENEFLTGLTEAQMRLRPHPAVNTIVWLVWHMARCEDVPMNRFVAERPQVLEEGKWLERLNLSRQDIGTGMTDEEVNNFSDRVDVPALGVYYRAVGQRSREIVSRLNPADLDTVVDPAIIRGALYDEGVMGAGAGWIEQSYQGKPKGWFFRNLGLVHNVFHLGEAVTVLGLQGVRGR
jgi:hypothetical protein